MYEMCVWKWFPKPAEFFVNAGIGEVLVQWSQCAMGICRRNTILHYFNLLLVVVVKVVKDLIPVESIIGEYKKQQ